MSDLFSGVRSIPLPVWLFLLAAVVLNSWQWWTLTTRRRLVAQAKNWPTEKAQVVQAWSSTEPKRTSRTRYWEGVVRYNYPGFHGEAEIGEHHERFYEAGVAQEWTQLLLRYPDLQVRVEPREGKRSVWEEGERVAMERRALSPGQVARTASFTRVFELASVLVFALSVVGVVLSLWFFIRSLVDKPALLIANTGMFFVMHFLAMGCIGAVVLLAIKRFGQHFLYTQLWSKAGWFWALGAPGALYSFYFFAHAFTLTSAAGYNWNPERMFFVLWLEVFLFVAIIAYALRRPSWFEAH